MRTILTTSIVLCLGLAATGSMTAAKAANPTIPTPQQQAIDKKIFQLGADADSALDAGKYAIAEADARKALSMGWLGGTCRVELAAALYEQGKDKEALAAYKEIAEDSDRPNILLPYALLLLKNGQYPQAVVAYNKAISIYDARDLANVRGAFSADVQQPTKLEAACHVELGQVWTSNGLWGGNPNFIKALDEYQRALQLSPDNALANFYKGDMLKRLGFKTQAHDAYAKAAKFGDGDVRKAAEDALAGR